jgi:hypothetical protein
MTGITQRLPFPFSGRTSAQSKTFVLKDVAYDFAIGGMPWLSASSDQNPMARELAPIRKQQFDNAREAGEQSLVDWWLRSQPTFIGGEGLLYQDPDQVGAANLQNRHTIRYGHSVGLNPWVDGQLSMLRSTTQRIADGSANTHFVQGYNDGADRYWSAVNANLKSDDGTTATAVTWGGSAVIRSLTTDGTHYLVADNVGIWQGTGSGAGAKIYNTGTTNVVIDWTKGRLMAGIDNKLYELVTAGPALAPGDLRFTHLNPSWVWTSISDGPNAIYAAGFAGSKSSIYKFVLNSSGVVPTLSNGGTITCELPNGEFVNNLVTYLGSFVGISTNRGFRVGQIDTNGDIAYGPLLITGPTYSCGAYDRFFFVGATNNIDGNSGLWRIDLGMPIADNSSAGQISGARFAYATDLQAHATGNTTGVTNFGNSDRMVFAVVGQGAYLESATVLEPTGYFETARIRFNTQEPKIFKFLSVKTPASFFGTLGCSIEDTGGGTTSVVSVTEGSAVQIENVLLSVPPSASEWVKLRLDFGRSVNDTTKGMVVNGWQFKVIPGSVRQRIFTVPVYCFDIERDKNGQNVGYENRSLARLEQFEQIAQKGDSVTFQDLQQNKSYLVIIDEFQFVQKAEPGPNTAGYGGILTMKLRTIADVITF